MEALSLFGHLADDKPKIEVQASEPIRKAVVRGARTSGCRAAWVALDVVDKARQLRAEVVEQLRAKGRYVPEFSAAQEAAP